MEIKHISKFLKNINKQTKWKESVKGFKTY